MLTAKGLLPYYFTRPCRSFHGLQLERLQCSLALNLYSSRSRYLNMSDHVLFTAKLKQCYQILFEGFYFRTITGKLSKYLGNT